MEWNEHWLYANWPRAIICMSVAYIIGCISTGYYLVLIRTGKDIREKGSGSAGARNVGRVLGRAGFFLTVLGDFAKGMLAVWLAREMTHDNFCAALAVPAVVAGHLWPAQLKFHGGKGVTTSMAALLVFDARLSFATAGLFVAIFIFTRRSLLPAMFAFLCLPAVSWYFTQSDFTIGTMAVLSAMILFAHRKNLAEEFVTLKSEPTNI